ncbi:hypothetical protein BGW39_001740 [Mortierella sp. 14UC]|nr:hypothetical protein BGW39_001740 [Mortierella sp. 14UC]
MLAINSVHSSAGLATSEQKARWVKHIKNDTWNAYWMPFQDQIHKATKGGKLGTANNSKQDKIEIAKAKADFVSQSKVGEGCGLLVFYIHRGERAPETPFLGPLEDCLNAYKALVTEYGVDSRRIVFGGDSAGGNSCYSLALKVRDRLDANFLSAAIYSSSPYVPWTDKLDPTIFDTVNPDDGDFYVDAYMQQRPEILPAPMALRVWVEVETMAKPDRSHCWFKIDPVTTIENLEECVTVLVR